MICVLQNESNDSIEMTATEEVHSFIASFDAQHSNYKNVYCFADGLKLLLEHAGALLYKIDTIKIRNMIIMLQIFFCFHLMDALLHVL